MASTFGTRTTAQEVVDRFPDQVAGKYIIVTGTSPLGIGQETARALATKGPRLLALVGRDQAKLDQTKAEIVAESPAASLATVVCDLGSFASVRAAAGALLALGDPDMLINNAAIMACPYAVSADGLESQLATNYAGPWLLTNLLLPALLRTPAPRIVNVSSMGHMASDVVWDDMGFSGGKTYNADTAYGQSKTAVCLFTVELAERYGAQGLVALSLHPGGISTPLQRYWDDDKIAFLRDNYNAFTADGKPNFAGGMWKTVPQGASTTLVAALDPAMAAHNGQYLNDCVVAKPWAPDVELAEAVGCVMPHALDKAAAKKLWAITEGLVGESF